MEKTSYSPNIWKNINSWKILEILEKFLKFLKSWKYFIFPQKNLLNVVVKKDAPLKLFTLYDGLTNWWNVEKLTLVKKPS